MKTLAIIEMGTEPRGYTKWKLAMKDYLDSLVVQHFKDLFQSSSHDYLKIWGTIGSEVYDHFGLTEIKQDDPEYGLKKRQEHCVYMNLRQYVEKTFPYFDERTLRFVQEHQRLPHQAPSEWDSFDSEKKKIAAARQTTEKDQLYEAIRAFEREHPGYKLS